MRIILINELYNMGGSEIQTLREIDLLRKNGHDVWHITFDKNMPYCCEMENNYHLNLYMQKGKGILRKSVEWLYDYCLLDRKLFRKLQSIFEYIKPDVIHINTIGCKPITIYSSVEKYKCVQTIRDYSAVCPKSLCIKKDYSACRGYLYEKCFWNCISGMSSKNKVKFCFSIPRLKRINRIRNRNVDRFICPSQCLTDTCCHNKLKTKCVNNPFDFSLLDDYKKKMDNSKKVYLVYGWIAEHKGIRQIVDAFSQFSEGENVELHIIGKVDNKFCEEFNRIAQLPKVVYLGSKSNKEIIKYLERVYCVIVPSLWLENYPNTALEGLATKCLVIGSNRGGIPEIVQEEKFLFDILDKKSIVETLKYANSLSSDDFCRITNDNFARITELNSLELYYRKIMDVFNEVIR